MNPILRISHNIILLFLISSSLAQGAQPDKSEIMVTSDGYAIHGFDPVAYFNSGAPAKGLPEYSAKWQNATWLFASAEHRDAFIQNPDKFAPQYGGWCAYGMAEGYAAETDPLKAWTIHEGKLYLNWNEEVSRLWSLNLTGYLRKSNSNWPDVQRDLRVGKAKVHWYKGEN